MYDVALKNDQGFNVTKKKIHQAHEEKRLMMFEDKVLLRDEQEQHRKMYVMKIYNRRMYTFCKRQSIAA